MTIRPAHAVVHLFVHMRSHHECNNGTTAQTLPLRWIKFAIVHRALIITRNGEQSGQVMLSLEDYIKHWKRPPMLRTPARRQRHSLALPPAQSTKKRR
jgi:hypothetical protein